MTLQRRIAAQPRLEDISCQDLLDRDVRHSGFLKRKAPILKNISRWASCYVVIFQGSLYFFSGSSARKPDFTCSLLAYERVEVHKDRTHEPLWVFSLIPLVSSMPTQTLAAPSKRELGPWLAEVRLAMLTIHNQPTSSVQLIAERMKAESNWSLEEDQYEQLAQSVCPQTTPVTHSHQNEAVPSIANPQTTPVTHSHQNEAVPSIANPQTTPVTHSHQNEAVPSIAGVSEYQNIETTPCVPEVEESAEALPTTSQTNDSEAYYSSAFFSGTREEAVNELVNYECDGIYLIRQNEGRQVLTVKSGPSIVKYCLEQRPADGFIHIQGGNDLPSFPNLSHLLHHYHHNDLPNRNFKLSVPFRLAERES